MSVSSSPGLRRALVPPLLVLLAACSGAKAATAPGSASSEASVVLHVGDQKAGSQALLEASGELKGLPYKISWSQFTSGPPLLEAINAGAIEVGAVGDTPPVFAAAAGSHIVIVGASNTEPVGSAILVPKTSSITSVADLKGRKVALAKGSSANYHLLSALAKAGLSFHDITPVYLAPADALSAFTGGTVDAWVIWDPYTALAQQQTGARVLVTGQGYLSGNGFQVASPAAVKDPAKKAALADYLTRLAKARAWTREHRDAWSATWAKATGLPLAVASTAVTRGGSHSIAIDAAVVTSEQQEADAFAKAGLLPHPFDMRSFFDDEFNATASAQ